MARKKKKNKGLFVMLGLIVVLCIAYFAVNALQTQKEEEKAEANKTIYLYQAKTRNIRKIRVKNEYTDITLLQNEDLTWEVEGEADFPLNEGRVDYWASSLAMLVADKKVADKVTDTKTYGLDHPTMIIDIEGEDGNATLTMGGRSALADSFYMQKEGDPALYTIGSGLYYSLNRPAVHLLAVEEPERFENIQSVEVLRKDEKPFLFGYDESGVAVVKQPYPTAQPMNEEQEAAVIKTYRDFYFEGSEGYANEVDLSEFGLAQPTAEIRVVYGETTQETFELAIGDVNEDGDYFVWLKNSDRIYTMTDDHVEEYLAFEPFQYVRPQVFAKEELSGMITANDDMELNADAKAALENVVLERDLPADADLSGEAILTLHVGEDRELAFYPYDGANFYRLSENGESLFLVGLREVDAVIAALSK
ncbi:MAG: DUF4340 domain-containing protein [Lachnospiraceae bacterium]|nr:DUF4340 domain-containing protein [Lachnospiraceae bacterium]